MKKLICLLVFCMMLCGCGNKESDPISNKPPIEVDEEKLESEGYKNLSEIAYGKVEDNGDKPNVNLVYLTQKPEEAIYLWTGIQRNLLGNNVESDTSFSWGDNKYVLDDESMDKMTAENAEDYVPKEWADLLRKMESGYNINDGISKELGDSMDEAIDEFVDEYLEESKKELNVIDGFREPDYEKFNSYASENGLDGTLIYIEGKLLSQTQLGRSLDGTPTLALVVEQEDGNKWCAGVTSECEIEEIKNKNVRIFGTYQGFSDRMKLPGISVVVKNTNDFRKARIEIEENGNYIEVWNFYDNWTKLTTEGRNEENEESEPQPQETPIPTTGQQNALKSAKEYLDISAFSYSGLVSQLEYEQYTHEEAVYAVDNCGADWNEQAARSAKEYLDIMSFSRGGLIEQLEFDGFTHEQAVYGVEQNGY